MNLLNENSLLIESFLRKTIRKKCNSLFDMSTNKSIRQKEIGGTIWLKNKEFMLNKSENSSNKRNEFISEFDIQDLLDEDFQGFWHSHPKYCLPSPPDIFQLIKLNWRFKRNYLLIILGEKRYSVVGFKYHFVPKIKIETLK